MAYRGRGPRFVPPPEETHRINRKIRAPQVRLIGADVLVMGSIIGVILLQALPLFRSMQTRIDTLNRVLREQISGLRVIRAFVREPYESQRFARANRDLTDTSLRVGRRMLTLFPVVQLVMSASSVGVMWFGGLRVDARAAPHDARCGPEEGQGRCREAVGWSAPPYRRRARRRPRG